MSGVGGESYHRARNLCEKSLVARVERYRSLLWSDRFDGTPNFDHREGEEKAMRAIAAKFGFEVPDERVTEADALAVLREAHLGSEDVARLADSLGAGLAWEYGE